VEHCLWSKYCLRKRGGIGDETLRKLIVSLGAAAASLGLVGPILVPRLLAEPPDRATALILAGSLFTIAIAAVVRD
jgi:hypothetical protein